MVLAKIKIIILGFMPVLHLMVHISFTVDNSRLFWLITNFFKNYSDVISYISKLVFLWWGEKKKRLIKKKENIIIIYQKWDMRFVWVAHDTCYMMGN